MIAAGGGGIPVVTTADGGYRGVDAVIDKDLAAERLATALGADALVLVTAVAGRAARLRHRRRSGRCGDDHGRGGRAAPGATASSRPGAWAPRCGRGARFLRNGGGWP